MKTQLKNMANFLLWYFFFACVLTIIDFWRRGAMNFFQFKFYLLGALAYCVCSMTFYILRNMRQKRLDNK